MRVQQWTASFGQLVEHVSHSRPRNSMEHVTPSLWNRSSFSSLRDANDMPCHVVLRGDKDFVKSVRKRKNLRARHRLILQETRAASFVSNIWRFGSTAPLWNCSRHVFPREDSQSARFYRLLSLRGKSCKAVPFRQDTDGTRVRNPLGCPSSLRNELLRSNSNWGDFFIRRKTMGNRQSTN